MSEENWHSKEINDCYDLLSSSPTGIHPKDVPSLQQKFGYNKLAESKPTHPFIRFISQYNDPLNYHGSGSRSITHSPR
jgi:magnesium-transporting ATPase (P-type)